MYNNPLMVLREYVQNAVDAIELAEREEILPRNAGTVSVTIDGQHRQIVIEDNGIGLKSATATTLLGGVGLSSKRFGDARGFRGIGRLGGLGYADELCFETRSVQQDFVQVVCWNVTKLQTYLRNRRGHVSLAEAIKAAVRVSKRAPHKTEGSHFFRVTLRHVRRFHRDDLLNIERVATYLSRVAPIPFRSDDFPFAEKVDEYLSAVDGYRCFTVELNGRRLYRPHRRAFGDGPKKADEIHDVTLFEIPGPNGCVIGRGWHAKTNCIASLPSSVTMRGVKVRQGNIEIGDEYFLAEWFTERRFATWHIGELHVDYQLRANARRDGFEEGEAFEALLEYSTRMCRQLSKQCRQSSLQRTQRLRLERGLDQMEKVVSEETLVVDKAHLKQKQALLLTEIAAFTKLAAKLKSNGMYTPRLEKLQTRVGRLRQRSQSLRDQLDGRKLRPYKAPERLKDLLVSVAVDIVKYHDDQDHVRAERLVRQVMAPFSSVRE